MTPVTPWKVEYDNDGNGGFAEWWDVTNDDRYIRCYEESTANWLCEILNNQPSDEETTPNGTPRG